MESYISPKAHKGLQSGIHGRGLFAKEAIFKGEIVAVKGGDILTREQLAGISTTLHAELQIADDLFIAPTNIDDFDKSMMHINHSCNPNVGMRGNIVFVAIHDILPSQELTIDYAMIDNGDGSFACACASPLCRKEITGKDWRKREIQERYKGCFTSYIESLILAG